MINIFLILFLFSTSAIAGLPKIQGINVALPSDVGGDLTKIIQSTQINDPNLSETISNAIINRDITAQSFGTPIQQIEQKNENEHSAVVTGELDYAMGDSFYASELNPYAMASDTQVKGGSFGMLLKNYTSGSSTMYLVWNPMCLVSTTGLCSDSTEKGKTESTTGWTAQFSTINLTTNSSTFVLGLNSLSFQYTTLNSRVGIQKDLGSGTGINIQNNTDLWFAINIPDVGSNFTDVYVQVNTDISNGCKFTTTTNSNGGPLVVGWNWININLAQTCPTVVGGGWIPSTTFRYFQVGEDLGGLSSPTDTVLVDAIAFGSSSPSTYIAPGDELGINGASSIKFNFDASNATFAGPVAIANPPSASFGADNTYFDYIDRGMFVINGTNTALPVTGLNNLESFYQKKNMKSSVTSGHLTVSVSVNTPIELTVTSVPTTGQIIVADSTGFSSVILNGTIMDVLQPIKKARRGLVGVDYVSRGIALNVSSSSAGVGVTTINSSNSNSGIEIGDLVVFRHVSAKYSLTSKQSNESFSSLPFVEIIGSPTLFKYRFFQSGLSGQQLSTRIDWTDNLHGYMTQQAASIQ